MSQTKLDIKQKFFKHDTENGLYICTIDQCGVSFKGALNCLKRHIANLHSDVAKSVGLDHYKTNKSCNKDNEPKSKKSKTVPVEIDPDEFVSGLVETAAFSGWLLITSTVLDSRKLLGCWQRHLDSPATRMLLWS